MTDKIIVKKDGAIGRIIFNNPDKLNAMSLEMWEAFTKAVLELDADHAIRVIVLRGAGEVSFVAGADVSKYEDERMGEDAQERYAQAGEVGMAALYNSGKIAVAAIDGWCIGGGISLAVSCDLRYCSEKSKFGQPAMRYGIGYRYKSLRRLVNVVGAPATKDMLLGGLQFDSQEALAKGLVGRVLPQAEFDAVIEKTLANIAAGAPLTAKQVKFTLNTILEDPADRDLEKCEAMFQACYASQDYREGIRAFAEKRKPVFVGA
jgi:enoyl-CoA hydratase/carnithine racemase